MNEQPGIIELVGGPFCGSAYEGPPGEQMIRLHDRGFNMVYERVEHPPETATFRGWEKTDKGISFEVNPQE